MQYFQATGTSYQIGVAHGKNFRSEIQRAFVTHCAFHLSDHDLNNICIDIESKLQQYLPAAYEELRGISDGSGLSFRQVILLNHWEEIAQLAGEDKQSGCTSIIFRDTEDGPILGKTTDIESFQVPDYFLFNIAPEQGYRMLLLGKIGTLKCEAGMNETGLCIGSNSSIEKNNTVGKLERMTLLRYLLQTCDNIASAVAYLKQYPFYRLGLNVSIFDQSGRAVVAECGNTKMAVREITGSVGYATNHYLTPEMAAEYDYGIWYYQNSMDRFSFLQSQFADRTVVSSVDTMKALIKAHPQVGSICNHTDCCQTKFATIWMPARSSVWVCDGSPCKNDFHLQPFLRQ